MSLPVSVGENNEQGTVERQNAEGRGREQRKRTATEITEEYKGFCAVISVAVLFLVFLRA